VTRFAHRTDDEGRVAGRAPRLTVSIIDDLKAKGYNQSEIARMYGVTRQHVSWIKHTYGGRLTPREKALKHFPFKVPAAMTHSSPYRRLRDHAEFVATNGVGMSADKLKRLRTFYRNIRENNLVLEFDPAIPPQPGVSRRGGWAYRPRTPEDGDLLIRVNEHTHLTEEGRSIWRLPAQEP